MTLYGSILENEEMETAVKLIYFSDKNPLLRHIISSNYEGNFDSDIEKSKLILDAAYDLRSSELSEEYLNGLVSLFDDLDKKYLGIRCDRELLDARKCYMRAKFEFYKQIINSAEESASFDDVVKELFDSESYRDALSPVLEAEIQVFRLSKERYPHTADVMDDLISAVTEFYGAIVETAFPKDDTE